MLLLIAAAVAPLLHLVALILSNYIDTPYYDTWSLYFSIAKFMNGGSSWWQFLHAQQNEARPAFPRLLLFLLHSVNRNLAIVVVLNIFSAVATAAITLLLLKKVNPGIRWPWLLAAGLLFNLNFFSVAQWQNWNWHNQVIMLLPNLFFALAWLTNVSSLPPLGRSALVSLCCAISTFCFANGLLQWFLVVPLAFGISRKEKMRVWGLYFGAAVLCFVLYFAGYKTPGQHHFDLRLFAKGSHLIPYFFAWIGSSLSAGSMALAQIWGAILVLTFILFVVQCFRIWRTDGIQIGWLPWLSMCCYALISGALADAARSHIGLEQALRPRYCTISQWLIVGIVGLSVTLLWQNRDRKSTHACAGLGLLSLLGVAFICFAARHEVYAAGQWKEFAETMHFQKQSFGLEGKQPGQLWTFQFPADRKQFVLFAYREMRKADFLHNFYRSGKILPLLAAHKTGTPNESELSMATYLPSSEIKCRGWSTGGNPLAGNRALIVLILPSGKVLAVADGPINKNRPDVLSAKRASSAAVAGFDLEFHVPKLDPGSYRLAAFRYDKNEKMYYPIGAPAALEIRE